MLKRVTRRMARRLQEAFAPKTADQLSREALLQIKPTATDIAIDCGANMGEITSMLSRFGAAVYAFEPNPYAFRVLRDRFMSHKNVRCFQKGVWDRNEVMKLYLHKNSDQDQVKWSTGSSLLDYKGNVSIEKYVEVDVIDLCEFIISLKSRVKILKLDVEGSECEILKKLIMTDTLKMIDQIFVETHDKKIPELKPATDEIRSIIKQKQINNINLDWV